MGWLRYLPEPQSSPIMLLQSNLVKNNLAYPYEQPQQIKFMAGSLYSSPTLSERTIATWCAFWSQAFPWTLPQVLGSLPLEACNHTCWFFHSHPSRSWVFFSQGPARSRFWAAPNLVISLCWDLLKEEECSLPSVQLSLLRLQLLSWSCCLSSCFSSCLPSCLKFANITFQGFELPRNDVSFHKFETTSLQVALFVSCSP